jgi:hypothetical protein
MHQKQEPLPFHTDQRVEKSEISSEVCFSSIDGEMSEMRLLRGARDREREREKDRRVEELEKRLASIESQCGAILPAEEWRPRGQPRTNGDDEYGTDRQTNDVASRDEYQTTYTPTYALGGSFLGAAPEESASGSQTSPTNTATTTESQRRMGRGDAGAGESEEEFLERIERIRSMKAGGIGAGESVEQFMKRMERIRSGDCGGCSLISSSSQV